MPGHKWDLSVHARDRQEEGMCLRLCEHAWIKDHDGESGSAGLSAWRVLTWFIFYLFNCFCERGSVFSYCVVLWGYMINILLKK